MLTGPDAKRCDPIQHSKVELRSDQRRPSYKGEGLMGSRKSQEGIKLKPSRPMRDMVYFWSNAEQNARRRTSEHDVLAPPYASLMKKIDQSRPTDLILSLTVRPIVSASVAQSVSAFAVNRKVDLANPARSMVRWAKQYGPVFTVHLPKPIVVVAGHEALKETLVGAGEAFAGRPDSFLYGIFTGHRPDGDGIILSQGARWTAQRRFALRAFRQLGMGTRKMDATILFHVNTLLVRIQKEIYDLESAVMDLHYPLAFCIGNIIQEMKEIYDLEMLLVDEYPWMRFFLPGYRRYVEDGFALQRFFLEEIERHELALDTNEDSDNFIDAYLKDIRNGEKELSKLTLALNAGDLWTGGMETTVTTLRWMIAYLIHYPGIQRELHEEISAVVGLRPVSSADRLRLPKVRAAIDEIQRIVNVLPWHIPHTLRDTVTLHGYRIPAGTTVMPQPGAVAHDPRLFPQPEHFRIGRFLSEKGEYRAREELTPFGLGKRQCLGEGLARAELFLILVSLLQHFEFGPAEELPSLEKTPGMASVPHEFECSVRRRNFGPEAETLDARFHSMLKHMMAEKRASARPEGSESSSGDNALFEDVLEGPDTKNKKDA
uniref:Cytochrome P450 n=1 Tax=Steinernema glaseri TaxID=37863 RepID=A0A1I7ZAK0_9BILA